MKPNFASLLTAALVSGLVAGSVAFAAEGDAPAPAGDQQQMTTEGNAGGAATETAAKTTTAKKTKKGKNGCNGKDGCGQKDKDGE